MVEKEVAEWKKFFQNYKAGDILRAEFNHADQFAMDMPPEMIKISVRIGLFGMTGAGKSSFVNSVHKCLSDDDSSVSGLTEVQSTGGEGTIILEEYFARFGFRLIDTRGFEELEKEGEQEILDILYGHVTDGAEIVREHKSGMTACGPKAQPNTRLSKQLHAVMWFMKSTDVRLQEDKYIGRMGFLKHHLHVLGVTVIPVITHYDCMSPDKEDDIRSKVKQQWKNSRPAHFITNYLPGKSDGEYGVTERLQVLKLLNSAVEVGERSIRTRQLKADLQ